MLVHVLIATFVTFFGLVPEAKAHDRPVIGILLQEISPLFKMMYPNRFDSFIPASYVKWVESGGARVVPLWIGRDRSYYEQVMSKINGVLLPGGNIDKNEKDGYAEAAERIMNIAVEMNLNNDFFPVFGIGLGMDFMLYLSNEKNDISVDCHLSSIAATLILSQKNTKQTALYNSSSDHIKRMITQHPVAVLNAKKCYPKDVYESSKLSKLWIPFSYNYDLKGKMIISSVEHDVFPFYGTLFHSEKIPFEWAENTNFPHTLATVEVSQYFANYFVNEARKSDHVFKSKQDILDHLIQNFQSIFTARDGSNYFETYLFNRDQEM